jgi:hypothetical protein
VVSQNKPLLVFMAECGADLSMACMGPPQEHFMTPVQMALVQGFNSVATLLDDLIREQPSSAQASLLGCKYTRSCGGVRILGRF